MIEKTHIVQFVYLNSINKIKVTHGTKQISLSEKRRQIDFPTLPHPPESHKAVFGKLFNQHLGKTQKSFLRDI